MKRFLSLFILTTLIANTLLPYTANAQINNLPAPAQLLSQSQAYSFPVLRGLKLDSKNPLNIQFIIDPGTQKTVNKDEAGLLIKYFLAALTIPRENLWVNLSPYEQNRIIPATLSQTELGEDMLGQDYLLKQLASSLTHPESPAGKQYWQTASDPVIASAAKQSSNKVWISAGKSQIYEGKNVAIITQSSLKVSMDADHAFKNNILPLIDQEVNRGKNFAQMRQIYHAVILGLWFKNKFKDSFYKNYLDKETVNGIDTADKDSKDKIYAMYVEAFKKGVYNYTKSERTFNKITKRNYFSGGAAPAQGLPAAGGEITTDPAAIHDVSGQPVTVASTSVLPNHEQNAIFHSDDEFFQSYITLLKQRESLSKIEQYIDSGLTKPELPQDFADYDYNSKGVALAGYQEAMDAYWQASTNPAYKSLQEDIERSELNIAKKFTQIKNSNKRYFDFLETVFPGFQENVYIAIWCAHILPGSWRPLTPAEKELYDAGNKTIIVHGKPRTARVMYDGTIGVTTCTQEQIDAKIDFMRKYGSINDDMIMQLMDQGFLGVIDPYIIGGLVTAAAGGIAAYRIIRQRVEKNRQQKLDEEQTALREKNRKEEENRRTSDERKKRGILTRFHDLLRAYRYLNSDEALPSKTLPKPESPSRADYARLYGDQPEIPFVQTPSMPQDVHLQIELAEWHNKLLEEASAPAREWESSADTWVMLQRDPYEARLAAWENDNTNHKYQEELADLQQRKQQAEKILNSYIAENLPQIILDNQQYFDDLRSDWDMSNASKLSDIQLMMIWYTHKEISSGWRVLDETERSQYKEGDALPDGKTVYRVHTGDLAVTNCTPEQIQQIYTELEKDTLFTHAQAKRLMDKGWLGSPHTLWQGAKFYAYRKMLSHYIKTLPSWSSFNDAERALGRAQVDYDEAVARRDAPMDGDYDKYLQSFVGYDHLASALPEEEYVKQFRLNRSHKDERMEAENALAALRAAEADLANEKARLNAAMIKRQAAIMKSLQRLTALAKLTDRTNDIREDYFMVIRDLARENGWSITDAQLQVIWQAHNLPGGWHELAKNENDPKAINTSWGGRIVTTGTVEQNTAKLLHVVHGGVSTDIAKKLADNGWMSVGSDYWQAMINEANAAESGSAATEENSDTQPEPVPQPDDNSKSVGGVTWKDTVSEKAAGSKDFQFENIPAIGEIKSMGFVINALQLSTISELIK